MANVRAPNVIGYKKETKSIIKLVWGGFSEYGTYAANWFTKPEGLRKMGSIYTVVPSRLDSTEIYPIESRAARTLIRASAALILDLKQRGIGGYFGYLGRRVWKNQLLVKGILIQKIMFGSPS